ncbi:MAG: ribonuclease HI family protein [Nitrospirae bacterium]|nr:ribonuclease HI family protein [Nitrospirota bacterium]
MTTDTALQASIVDLEIYVDGASRGNPGPAGGGAVLKGPEGGKRAEIVLPLGRTTNNVAEYSALVAALQAALQHGARRIRVYSDSQLLVNQVTGVYKVRHERIVPLWTKVLALLGEFERWELVHIRRKLNGEADRLANQAASRSEAGEGPAAASPASTQAK